MLADALSRPPCTVAATQLQSLWSEEDIRNSQKNDPDIKMVLDHLRLKQSQPSTPKTVKHLLRQRHRLHLDPATGILYCLFDTKGKQLKQLLLPKKLVPEVLSLAHDHVCSGHLGTTRTVEKVRQRFYWPTMFNDIATWCRTCEGVKVWKEEDRPNTPTCYTSTNAYTKIPLAVGKHRHSWTISLHQERKQIHPNSNMWPDQVG